MQLTYFPALLVLGPTVAKEHLNGAAGWGTILSVEALGAVVGGLVALRLRVSLVQRRRTVGRDREFTHDDYLPESAA